MYRSCSDKTGDRWAFEIFTEEIHSEDLSWSSFFVIPDYNESGQTGIGKEVIK